MFDIWIQGMIVVAIIMAIVVFIALILGGLSASIDDDPRILRLTAILFTTSPLTIVFWPVVVAAVIASAVGWGCFTSARVIRHRSLMF